MVSKKQSLKYFVYRYYVIPYKILKLIMKLDTDTYVQFLLHKTI